MSRGGGARRAGATSPMREGARRIVVDVKRVLLVNQLQRMTFARFARAHLSSVAEID
jgi:hypothetical protein